MEPGSLFDKKRMGGLIGAGGYDFETSYILSQLPTWITNDQIKSFQRELWSDVEIFLGDGQRWLFQIKDHKLELGEFKTIIRDFSSREVEKPGLYKLFCIICQDTSSTLKKVENLLARYRDIKHLPLEELASSKKDLEQRLINYGLDSEQINFLIEYGEKLVLDSKTNWVADEPRLRKVFTGSLKSEFNITDELASLLFLEWARLLNSRRGRLIVLKKLREHLKRHFWRPVEYSSYDIDESKSSITQTQPLNIRSIPIPDKNFVGREELILDITETANSRHFIAILGIQGVGKTAIMKQIASQYDTQRIFWYEFYPGLFSLRTIISDLADFLSSVIGSNLGFLSQHPFLTDNKRIALLLEILNSSECYLFFDSAQFIEDDPAIVSFFTILKDGLQLGNVFIASRSIPSFFNPIDEIEHRTKYIELEGLTEQETKNFFESSGFELKKEYISEIHYRFGGSPIALELIRLLLVQGFKDSETLNIVDKTEANLLYLFQQVFYQLNEKERQLLRVISLFSVPFSLHQAIGFYQEILRGNEGQLHFDKLHKDLLITQHSSEYYQTHEIIRSLARRYTDNLDELRLQLANYLSEKHKEDFSVLFQVIILYFETESFARAAELIPNVFDSITIRHFPGIAQTALNAFSEGSVNDEQWVWLLHRQGNLAEYLHKFDKAQEKYVQMLQLAERLGDKRAIADAFQSLSILNMNLDLELAEQYCLDSLALYKELEDISSAVNAHNTLGAIYIDLGKNSEALTVLNNGLRLLDDLEDLDAASWRKKSIYINLGHLYGLQGQWEEAVDYTQKAFAIIEKSGSPYDVSRITYDLGVHEAHQGNFKSARKYYARALEIAETYELLEVRELAHIALGKLNHESGDYDAAIAHFKNVIEIREGEGDIARLVLPYFDVGTFYGQKGDYDNALEYYGAGLSLFEYIVDEITAEEFLSYVVGLAMEVADSQRIIKALKQLKNRLCAKEISYALSKVYGTLGAIYFHVEKKYRVALVCFRQEISLLQELDRTSEMVVKQIDLGNVLEQLSRFGEAIEYYSNAIEIGEVYDLDLPTAIALYNRSNSFAIVEMLDKSEIDLKRALTIARSLNDERLEDRILFNLGEIYRRQKRFKDAIELSAASLEYARQEEDIDSEIDALNNLGLAYEGASNFSEAIIAFEMALHLCKKHYRKSAEARILISLGNHYLEVDNLEQAKNYYEEAFDAARAVEDIEWEEYSMLSLAHAHRQLGTSEDIVEAFQEIGNRASELGRYEPLLEFTKIAAAVNLDEGEVQASIDMFVYALEIAIILGYQRIQQFISHQEKPELMPEFSNVFHHIRYCLYETMQRGAMSDAKALHSGLINKLRAKEEWWVVEGEVILEVLEAMGDDFDRFSRSSN